MSLDIDIPMIAVVRGCSREVRKVEESYRKRISKKKRTMMMQSKNVPSNGRIEGKTKKRIRRYSLLCSLEGAWREKERFVLKKG